MCCFTWATVRSQQLLFVALAAGLWCFTAGCHVKSPLFPNPSQTEVCSTMGESIRSSSFHNRTHSANKHVIQTCGSSLSSVADGLADGSGEGQTSPFNGNERSLSRAVVPKTKSLRTSAATFPTACLCTSRGNACERISATLGEITLSFATCGTVHHWRAGSEVALET